MLHRHHFLPPLDDDAYRIFSERVARTNYERRWKHTYRGPGFKAHLLAVLVFIIPKVGAAADLAIKIPTADTEERYLSSVNHTVDAFRDLLQKLGSEPKWSIALANIDLDTGDRVKRGDYPLADETYAKLLRRIASRPDRTIPIDLQRNLLRYYGASQTAPPVGPRVQAQLNVLKRMRTGDGLTPEPEPEVEPEN